MNIGEILICEAANGLLLIPVAIELLMLRRWIQGWPVFTERDWLFLVGPQDKAHSFHFPDFKPLDNIAPLLYTL
jgi:hypothetical protein